MVAGSAGDGNDSWRRTVLLRLRVVDSARGALVRICSGARTAGDSLLIATAERPPLVKLAKEVQPPDGLRLLLDTALGSRLHFIKKREGHDSARMLAEAKISIWMDPRRLKGPGLGITMARCNNPSRKKKAALTITLLENS